MHSIDALIVNYNSGDTLNACIKLLQGGVNRIIVIDNGSTDGSIDNLEGCEIIKQANLGFAAGVNTGIKKSTADYLLICNPDIEINSENIKLLVNFLTDNKDAAIAGPAIYDNDGNISPSGRIFPSFKRELAYNLRLQYKNLQAFSLKYEHCRTDFTYKTEVDEVSGACFLVTKKAIDDVGFMDEKFFLYYEEVDWCRRFKDNNWKIWYYPDAKVKHIGGHSTNALGINKFRYSLASQFYYFKKHHSILEAYILWITGKLFFLRLQAGEFIRGKQ